MFKIDDKCALVLIDNTEDVYKVAKALSDIDELSIESDEGSSEFFNLVFSKDNSRVVVADRQKLKEIFIRKLLENHPEISEDDAEEQASIEIQNMEDQWGVDFDTNLGPTPGEVEEAEPESEVEPEEEGLASEEEVSQIEKELEQESETEEEAGLLGFADEIKTMYEQGAGVKLLYKPNGKNLTIVEVKDNGIVAVDEASGKKGLLSNETLDERSDQFDILQEGLT